MELKNRRMEAWIFAPDEMDDKLEWIAPENYVPEHFGEIRFKMKGDTSMDDGRWYRPGWKRVPHLDFILQGRIL